MGHENPIELKNKRPKKDQTNTSEVSLCVGEFSPAYV